MSKRGKVVELYGGGTRPETEADREREARWAKAEADADAGKAYLLACGLENPIREAESAMQALRIIAQHPGFEPNHQMAIMGLANTIGDALVKIEEAQGEITHVTWAYAIGSRKRK